MSSVTFMKNGIQFAAFPALDDTDWLLDDNPLRCIEINCGGDKVWLYPVADDVTNEIQVLHKAVAEFRNSPDFEMPGWYDSFNPRIENRVWLEKDREREDNCAHSWAYTGTEYGGDDESYHGEGRAYCTKCGADGDA